jgi:hypothetical protein
MSDVMYLLTMTAVYDHGCAGVFTTREAAIAQAERFYADSDRHHTFRIDRVLLDEPIDVSGRGDPNRKNSDYLRGAWYEEEAAP